MNIFGSALSSYRCHLDRYIELMSNIDVNLRAAMWEEIRNIQQRIEVTTILSPMASTNP
ncbi:MAG: hypothetical protein JRH18_16810 [Deltaproteobacteria bacterium]|nr:hypothetical protein [Deltaproteobacteria bacterium]MBW2153318.1 hypothetical protein [Deltaproteobacteria bacterium]